MSVRERGPLEWDSYAYSFGHRLVTIRKARGLSQEQVAERSGLHRNAVSNLERGTGNRPPKISDPQLSTVYRLAHALDVPPSYLLPDADGPVAAKSAEQRRPLTISVVEKEIHQLFGK